MRTIKTTHIDNGGHGYYSVSKKDIEILGIADKISGYSGQTLNRVYLEEDSDATLLYNTAKDLGITIVSKSGYNLNFNIHHNYKPDLFNWIPKIGQTVFVGEAEYYLAEITNKNFIVTNSNGNRFKITLSNPFAYITKVTN